MPRLGEAARYSLAPYVACGRGAGGVLESMHMRIRQVCIVYVGMVCAYGAVDSKSALNKLTAVRIVCPDKQYGG